jgi:hypothetical protein
VRKAWVETVAAIAAAGALVAAVPAAAHPGPGDHPGRGNHGSKGAEHSRKCDHKVGYVEGGTIDATTASTLAQNADGTWSGTLVVDVTRANHWARADKGKTVTYTFTNATLKVHFDGGATAGTFTAGERVHLIGKLSAAGKHCTAPSTPAAPVFRMVVVHPASTGSTSSGSDSSSSGSGS